MRAKKMEKFKYAGKKMRVVKDIRASYVEDISAGDIVEVEDYWINVAGESCMSMFLYNPACCMYKIRAEIEGLPKDDNVVYAKSKNNLGYLFHVSELEPLENEKI